MWGLLCKDFAVLKKELLIGGLAILLFSVEFFLPWASIREANGGATNPESLQNLIFGMLPFFSYLFIFAIADSVQNGIFAHDERKVWSSFVTASPLGVEAQVLSKYYLNLLVAFLIYVWGFICDNLCMLIHGIYGSASGIYTLFFWINIIMRALEIPFLIRFGQKHGNIYKMLLIAVLAFLVIVYALFGYLPENFSMQYCFDFLISLSMKQTEMSTAAVGVIALLPYAAIGLYYLSYKISCKLYRKGVECYEA